MAQRFLSDLEVESEETRKAVVSFIPAAFASVGAMARQFYAAERRCGGEWNHSASCGGAAWRCIAGQPHACRKAASRWARSSPATACTECGNAGRRLERSICTYPTRVHISAPRRHVYTTPKSFLEMTRLYKGLLAGKRATVTASIQRLEAGLTKLRTTQGDVDVLVEQARAIAVEVRMGGW